MGSVGKEAVDGKRVFQTKCYPGQKPGTSGLRQKVSVFKQEGYTENFIQSTFDALHEMKMLPESSELLCSGDGRYLSKETIKIISEICAGNGVRKLIIGQNGWVSTPAASAIIRSSDSIQGAFILTASHNPGGPDEDFGIKYNCSNGGPAPESLTDRIYQNTLKITHYKKLPLQFNPVNTDVLSSPPNTILNFDADGHLIPDVSSSQIHFTIEIIDPCKIWMELMKDIFDFDAIRRLISRPDFKFVYDAMNGIGGPYARKLFIDELKAPESSLLRCDPLPDFGGHHPDPNLTYAKDLVDMLQVFGGTQTQVPNFGGAGDGDCDRNMILGDGWFVTPSDSLAIISEYALECIPYFKRTGGIRGLARSMPTSMAVENVARAKGFKVYEVPTGWKFFVNLMDGDQLSICGEESFGTGSNHIREKDGLWAILAWLSILAYRNGCFTETDENRQGGKSNVECSTTSPAGFVSVKQINLEFWQKYGRNFYTRFDYEGCEPAKAQQVLDFTEKEAATAAHPEATAQYMKKNPIKKIDSFDYVDPIDHSESKRQGIRVFLDDGSRFVLRLSGTGSSGATVRLYLEKYETDSSKFNLATKDAMKEFVDFALSFSNIHATLGRQGPTVIT